MVTRWRCSDSRFFMRGQGALCVELVHACAGQQYWLIDNWKVKWIKILINVHGLQTGRFYNLISLSKNKQKAKDWPGLDLTSPPQVGHWWAANLTKSPLGRAPQGPSWEGTYDLNCNCGVSRKANSTHNGVFILALFILLTSLLVKLCFLHGCVALHLGYLLISFFIFSASWFMTEWGIRGQKLTLNKDIS